MKEQKHKIWKSTEFWISISATIIALSSLIFTITESRRSREHDRRSTIPKIQGSFSFNKKAAGFTIYNAGLGPGRFDWFQVLVDGKPQTDWRTMLKNLGFDPVPGYHFIIPGHGQWWQAEKSAVIIEIPGISNRDKMKALSNRIDLAGCYCSIYDQCWRFRWNPEEKKEVQSCEPIPEIILMVAR